MTLVANRASKRNSSALRFFPYHGEGSAISLLTAVCSKTVHARNARIAWIFGLGSPLRTGDIPHGDRVFSIVEIITSEDRFWDACPCAPLVVGYVTDLLGVEATRWEFAKAIVRNGHVSTLFLGPGGSRDALELWVSATHEGSNGWRLRHSELPARSSA